MGKQELSGFHYGRSDLTRMGIFSEPNYISVGEPYQTKKGASTLDYRANGKQFLSSPPKHGHDSKDAYFDQTFGRLFENEPYTDLVTLRRRWRLKAKEKNITNAPFKPSSVPPKPYQNKSENKKKMVGDKPFISSFSSQEYFNQFAGLSKMPITDADTPGKAEKNILVPFKPSSGFGYTINPYPVYEPPKGTKQETPAPKATKSLIFKPSGVTGSYPIRSVIESACPLAPPVWLRETLRQSMQS
ncbi:hypothetical protein HDV01_005487 [Terramyces sp. JEL0728]|nr:hypothetical protein HDV01_005487 [Terramyces sp. JEL0728]